MSDIKLLEKIQKYKENHCYQYQKRLDTYEEDKLTLGWNDEFIADISVNDFEFVQSNSDEDKKKAKEFIVRYEWLESLSQFNTHYFFAYYQGVLGGVLIFSQPNAFSKLMGEDTKNIERLLSRGACASWTPRNLATKFISWAIKWMVNNTPYRLFTAYSDLMANERGTIYQALNWYYLGQKSGTTVRCINPYNPNVIISDRTFRARSFFKRYAKDLGIEWQKNWNNDQSVLWENIPDDIEKQLRDYSKYMYANAEKIEFPNKRKWAFVLGKDKRETKQLRAKFEEMNRIYPYPQDDKEEIRNNGKHIG